MEQLKVAVAQFQPKDGDKDYNLDVIEKLTARAKESGADIISFHELSITAYTFLKDLSKEELVKLSESVPEGPSTLKLITLARKYQITIMAGLVEYAQGNLYNTYICVDRHGLVGKFRKIHPFISKYLQAGNSYEVFDLFGWRCGILICYDNNLPENVRMVALQGAEVVFMPHVTCGLP